MPPNKTQPAQLKKFYALQNYRLSKIKNSMLQLRVQDDNTMIFRNKVLTAAGYARFAPSPIHEQPPVAYTTRTCIH